MPVNVSEAVRFGDLNSVNIENEYLRLAVFPELGAKIYDIIHKGTGTNVLWHNPRIKPRKVPFGLKFDDVYSGGWDEVFPTDDVSQVGMERLPEMGETWPLEWDYEIESHPDSVVLTTTVMTPITPAEIKRRLTLRSGEPKFVCDYEITNLSGNEINFLYKAHLAFGINDDCRIEVPGAWGVVDPRYRHLYRQGRYRWPVVVSKDGRKTDMSQVDPTRNDVSTHYVTDLSQGVVKFVDGRRNLVSTLHFDHKVLDNVWLFLAYGGWRGQFTAVIEPSTSYPGDLAEAIKKGTCSTLPGNSSLKTSIEFRIDPLEGHKKAKGATTKRSGE